MDAIRPSVLLIEDSEDDAFFFRYALEKTGIACRYFHVADGGAAMEFLEQAAAGSGSPWPDLVFLDLKLPTLTGFEILEAVRARGWPALNVTILSGSDQPQDLQRALSLGAQRYLVKPVGEAELRTQLASLHERRIAETLAGATQRSAMGNSAPR